MIRILMTLSLVGAVFVALPEQGFSKSSQNRDISLGKSTQNEPESVSRADLITAGVESFQEKFGPIFDDFRSHGAELPYAVIGINEFLGSPFFDWNTAEQPTFGAASKSTPGAGMTAETIGIANPGPWSPPCYEAEWIREIVYPNMSVHSRMITPEVLRSTFESRGEALSDNQYDDYVAAYQIASDIINNASLIWGVSACADNDRCCDISGALENCGTEQANSNCEMQGDIHNCTSGSTNCRAN